MIHREESEEGGWKGKEEWMDEKQNTEQKSEGASILKNYIKNAFKSCSSVSFAQIQSCIRPWLCF